MISFPYLKQTIKSNFKFLLAFTLVVCVFITVLTNVFTPKAMEGLQAVTEGTIISNILSGDGTLIGSMAFLRFNGHHISDGVFHNGGQQNDCRESG